MIALACAGDSISYAYPLSQCQDALANIFYCRRILRLHRDKAIGNHCPKQESDTRSLGEIGFFIAADMFLPDYRTQLVQCRKKFVRQGHHDILYSRGQLVNIDLLRSLRTTRAQGKAKDRSYH